MIRHDTTGSHRRRRRGTCRLAKTTGGGHSHVLGAPSSGVSVRTRYAGSPRLAAARPEVGVVRSGAVELRLQALETRIDADLHLGRHADVTAELRQLADVHPLREHLHAPLMLALYPDGRQAEALAVYQHARQVLVGELGTEPGAGLCELHRLTILCEPAGATAANCCAVCRSQGGRVEVRSGRERPVRKCGS
ncbi:MAG: AfsR/SARP family transcriptional regulator [Trebonia sp.]